MTYRYPNDQYQERLTGFMGVLLVGMTLASPWLVYQQHPLPWQAHAKPPSEQPLYQTALRMGWKAAVAVQTANSRQDWEAIVNQWDEAIALLESLERGQLIPADTAAQKLAEYRDNRLYAEGQATHTLPQYAWQMVEERTGEISLILEDTNPYDELLSGPPLEVSRDHVIQNLPYLNDVFAGIGLPSIQPQHIEQGLFLDVLTDEYILPHYAWGELVLSRSRCKDSLEIGASYDCLWKITLRQPDRYSRSPY